MMNVCHQCGAYRPDKMIDPAGPFAICPECGYRHPFKRLPLLTVSGASGTGKSTICRSLAGTIDGAIVLDADILWRDEFNHPENDYREFMELWLRMCKNISQAGKPVVLFGAGTGVPMNIEPCTERRYFSQVHYLALVCDNEVLQRRLEARPVWRKNRDPRYAVNELEFNNWFMEESHRLERKIELVDTTDRPITETAASAAAWIREMTASMKDVELRTERLVLRPFKLSDVDDVLDYTHDPEWARYQVNIPPVPLSRKVAEGLVTMFSDPPDSQGILQMFAVVLDSKVIGEICLNQHDEDRKNDRFELTYTFSRRHWRKELTTEGATAAMNWAFEAHSSFNRMYAWCDPRNVGSWRVMEKIGMRREGLLRHHLKWNGEYRDTLYYGILRSEWRSGLADSNGGRDEGHIFGNRSGDFVSLAFLPLLQLQASLGSRRP